MFHYLFYQLYKVKKTNPLVTNLSLCSTLYKNGLADPSFGSFKFKFEYLQCKTIIKQLLPEVGAAPSTMIPWHSEG